LTTCLTAACLLATFARAEATDAHARAGRDGEPGVAQRRAPRRKVRKKMSERHAPDGVAEGLWGGMHVRLNVGAGGVELEFDCAHGQISVPFKTGPEGRFDLPGTYTREGPGPIRLKHLPTAVPAHYSGRVEGSRMTLSVRLDDPAQALGDYSLTRGQEGRVTKCR
jgi:hypothetical protein